MIFKSQSGLLVCAFLCVLLLAACFARASDEIANTFPPVVQGFVTGVALDGAGNQYICGAFSGSSVDFNPGGGGDVKSCLGSTSTFVTRIDANGSYVWTQIFGGSTGDDEPIAIVVNGSQVLVTGFFSSADAGIGALGTLSATGSDDVFIISLAAQTGAPNLGFGTGGVLKCGGTLRDRPTCMALNGTTLYVAGSFQSADFGIGGAGTVATNTGAFNTFVFAVNPSTGAPVPGFGSNGIQKFGGSNSDLANAISVNAGVVYLAGGFTSSDAKIGNDTTTFATSGGVDAFVIALNLTTGNPVASFGNSGLQKFGGSANDIANSITSDGTNIYVAGYTNSTNCGIGGLGSISRIGSRSAFVLGLNPSGVALPGFGNGGVTLFGGSSVEEAHDILYGGNPNYLYVTGTLTSNNAGINGTGAVSTTGGLDAFVLALSSTTGAPVGPSFGSHGIVSVQTYCGSGDESGDHLVVTGNALYVAGTSNGKDAGIGAKGFFDHSTFGGVLLPLNATTGGPAFPVISGPYHTAGSEGQPFNFSIVSSGATVFSASNLPPGLNVNANTGVISGTPTLSGSYDVPIGAAFGAGAGVANARSSALLKIDILKDVVASSTPPIVTGNVANLAIDSAGNRYVCGGFAGTVDFNPSEGSDIKVCQGLSCAFVTKYNADNSYAWTQIFGGSGDATATGIAFDATNTVYVTGSFVGSNAGFGGFGSASAIGSQSVFAIALNPSNGTAVNSFGTNGLVRFGGTGFDYGGAIAFHGSTVYLAGTFGSSAVGIDGAATVTNKGSLDVFVLALNASGAAQSGFATNGVQRFAGTNQEIARAIAVSASGVVYVAGKFDSTNAGIGNDTSFSSIGSADGFVIALDGGTGAAIPGFGVNGCQKIGGSGSDAATAIAIGASNLLVTGNFASNNLGVGAPGSTASRSFSDVFVVQLNLATGQAVGSFGIPTFGGSGSEDAGGIVEASGVVYVTGTFTSTDAGIGVATSVSTAGVQDVFVFALNETDGSPVNNFGTAGVQRFGGTGFDQANAIGFLGNRIYIAGQTLSTDANIGGLGRFDGSAFGGFLLPLDKATGGPGFPIITSKLIATAIAGSPFTYTITSAPVLQSSAVAGLPPGLSLTSSAGGIISGTATTPGIYLVPISATTSTGQPTDGTATALLKLFVVDDAVANSYPPDVQSNPTAVAIDAQGNRYICGGFADALDFNPRVGTDVKSSSGQLDAYVTRFNADGSYAWTQTFGGSGNDFATALVVTGQVVLVCGQFSSTDAGFGGTGSAAALGNADAFVIALYLTDGSPAFLFGSGGIQRIGGSLDDSASSITISGGTIYVAGTFQSHDAGIGALGSANNLGASNAFVCALSAATGAGVASFGTGGFQTFGGTDAESAAAVATYGSVVFVTGTLQSGDAKIGGAGAAASSTGISDTYVLALDPILGHGKNGFANGGIANYGQSIGSATGNAIAIANGVVYAAGSLTVSGGSLDALVVAFNASSGQLVNTFGSNGAQIIGGGGTDLASSVAVSADGLTVYVGGQFDSATLVVGGSAGPLGASKSDAFILALKASDGTASTAFNAGFPLTFGGSEPDFINALAVSGTSLFAAGGFSSSDATLNGAGTVFDFFRFGGFLLQVDAASGTAVPVITSPLTAFGAPGDPFTYVITASNTPLMFETFGLPAGLTLNGNTISGNLPAIGGYTIELDAVNNFGVGPSVDLVLTVTSTGTFAITQFDSSKNPSQIGDLVTFTITATDPSASAVDISLDYGDGNSDLSVGSPQGVPIDLSHTYAAEGSYNVTVTVSDGTSQTILQLTQLVVAPNSGGLGVPNVSQGIDTVTNPVDNLKIDVAKSNGGVIELNIDAGALMLRTPLMLIQTDWGDRQGRSATVFGLHPVHKFIQRGIFVAKVTAKDMATGAIMGKGRKTLAISAKETGEVGMTPMLGRKKPAPTPGPLLNNSDVTTIGLKTFTGRFIFITGLKTDTVTFNGNFKLPAGFDPAHTHELSMGLGNIVVDAMVDNKGKGVAVSGTTLKKMKLTYKLKKGQVAVGGELATISATFTTAGMVLNGFDTEGISKDSTDLDAKRKAPRKIQVAFQLDGAAFETPIPVTFAVSQKSDFGTFSGRSGQ